MATNLSLITHYIASTYILVYVLYSQLIVSVFLSNVLWCAIQKLLITLTLFQAGIIASSIRSMDTNTIISTVIHRRMSGHTSYIAHSSMTGSIHCAYTNSMFPY